ncbi:hypothetical protein NQZ68_020985 [Dissostichus eleginoides]|nr:hypothetical protein NQZ68_020985 [Dissostichus eleginoides]
MAEGVCKPEEDEGPCTEEDCQSFHGVGVCKWFNVRMGFGFLSMTDREGVPLEEPVDVFVHQCGGCFSIREHVLQPEEICRPPSWTIEPCIRMKHPSAVTEPLFVSAAALLLSPSALMSFSASLGF